MAKHILDPLDTDKTALEDIFLNIAQSNSILFLGAGASVTDEKKYMSQQLMDYYEMKIHKQHEIKNIVEFIDILTETDYFSRSDFDNSVYDYLSNLRHEEYHKLILSQPWAGIITTNYDLLLEQAHDELKKEAKNKFSLKVAKSQKEIIYYKANDDIIYTKVNGCMSDKSRYPFVFSTKDFENQNVIRFHNEVIKPLRNLSNKIQFLSIGYSFSDPFAEKLLQNFDSINYRNKRPIFNVDPYVPDFRLGYLKSKGIYIIRLTIKDFFEQYTIWEEQKYSSKIIQRQVKLTNSNGTPISLSKKIVFNLTGSIRQFTSDYIVKDITEKDFYLGQEPDYSVIRKNYDVIRPRKLNEIKSQLLKEWAKNDNLIIPIFFLTGSFGTGKTTFTLRLIHELLIESNDNYAFEIIDFDYVELNNLIELFDKIDAKNIIIYCNSIENDSVFKELIELRHKLSTKQLPHNISFIVSIRQNILNKYENRIGKNFKSYNIDSKLDDGEIDEFIEKLHSIQLFPYKDLKEKNELKRRIINEFSRDSFISLLKLIDEKHYNGKHKENLRDAYYELSKDCQKAFLYTALFHRFDLKIPASLLREIISCDWDYFTENIIKKEGMGILIQEDIKQIHGVDPDLYFKTKHPIIADLLVSDFIKSKDELTKYYANIFKQINVGFKLSKLAIDLLKSLESTGDFSNNQINKFYDIAYKNLEDEPYFLLQYAKNLQSRGTKGNLLDALEILMYAQSNLTYRSDRFIHRQGSVNFSLAKLSFKEKSNISETQRYIEEAKDYYLLKQQLDPCSWFSYYEYIELLLWELDKINFEQYIFLQKCIEIEDLLDLALKAIHTGSDKIEQLREKYQQKYHYPENDKYYLQRLDELYENHETRPYACILIYNFYNSKNDSRVLDYFYELEDYTNDNCVCRFLFKEYGKKLYDTEIRKKFIKLSKEMDWYENENSLRYNFFNFVALSYEKDFSYAQDYLRKIEEKSINPEYKLFWTNGETIKPTLFDGRVEKKGKYISFKSTKLQKNFPITKDTYRSAKINTACNANLIFNLDGIRAVVVEEK